MAGKHHVLFSNDGSGDYLRGPENNNLKDSNCCAHFVFDFVIVIVRYLALYFSPYPIISTHNKVS